MGEFRLSHLRGEPTVQSVLTNIPARCKRIPELQSFSHHIVSRLELMFHEVAHRHAKDSSRVCYIDVVQHLLTLTRRKPLLVRLAKCETIALMFKELHSMLDFAESGFHRSFGKMIKTSIHSKLSKTYRNLTKWQKKWERDREEQISLLTTFVENTTDRQLTREIREDKMEEVVRGLRQVIDQNVAGSLLDLVKVTFNRVVNYCRLTNIQFVDWFISEDDLLFDNAPTKMGTFGAVRSALWFHDGGCTRVIVKQIYPDTSYDAEKDFFNELERWSNVANEHILKFYGGSHISKPRMFVCEYAASNFRDFFIHENNTTFYWPMFLQAAQGLKTLHTYGVIHGSLKCSNIMVTEDKKVKLMDFGFDSARAHAIVPNSEVASALAAEVRWKSKEVLEKPDLSDQRVESDIYSLGMCMIEAIVNIPFDFATNMEVTDIIMRGEKHRRPFTVLHDSSWHLIEMLCDPDYTKRPLLNEVIGTISDFIQVQEEYETAVDYMGNSDIPETRKRRRSTTYQLVDFDDRRHLPCPYAGVIGGMFSSDLSPTAGVIGGMFSSGLILTAGHGDRLYISDLDVDKQINCSSCTELSNEWWCRNCGQFSFAPTERDNVNQRNLLPRHVKTYNKVQAWEKVYEAAIDLQHFHDLGIIHGDVKPSNICIGRDGKAHLFGLKPSEVGLISYIPENEKLRWMAPECLSGGTSLQASDVYALGMSTIYVVSQTPPWGPDISDEEVMLQVRDKGAVVPRLKDFSDDEWALVERLCAYNIKNRMKIGDVIKQLSKWVVTNDTSAWRLPQSLIELSTDSPFATTPLTMRFVGKWKDAKVTVEMLTNKSDETKRNFQSVADLWFSLKHPTVVPLFGVCDDGKHPLFVSEYAERGDLSQYIRTTALQNDYAASNIVWQVLLDVAFAIHYLHSIGIVHGDVCLGNMLVGRDGHGKLSGFFQSSRIGLESPEEEPKTEGELCTCRHHPSFTSDVYWLGKCFINAFCLHPNSITESSRLDIEEITLLTQATRCDVCAMNPLPDRPEGFGDEQWKLVSDMCCMDPGDRVEMSDVVERLARIVAVNTAIKRELKSELRFDQSSYQKLQTAILQQVIEYEQEDSNIPSYDSDDDDYDDSCEETCGLLLTSMTSNITILDGLDRRANEAARKIFDDIETVLNDNPPTSKCLYLTFKNPIFRSDANRGVHPSSQESYERWYISSDNIVEAKRETESGKGAFASVHRGLWFGAPVMLKKLKQFNDGGQALRQEANIWYNLRHPHIVSLFGACITSFPLFVSEFVDGTRLEDCKNAEKKHLWGYLYDAAIGVQGIHLQNVVHGDLKCDNIMITADGRAKLIDFGLSCVQSWGGEEPRGAIQWKAPEWLAGDGPTFASDIYGLGMCIIQAITGSYPWGQMLDPVVRKLVSEGNLPKKRDFFRPREWELVERMCHNDPTIRPAIDSVVCELGEIVSNHHN